MPSRPRVFIGASTEGRDYTDAVFAELEGISEPVPWDRSTRPTQSVFESLLQNLANVDFAVFILTPDDERVSRHVSAFVARDNVLAELFLFIGHLGPERVFFLVPSGQHGLSLPTDLAGVRPLRIAQREDGNHRLMVRGACAEVRQIIAQLGIRYTEIRRESETTPREDSHGSARSLADLTDIEVRGKSTNTVAPEQFIKSARRELLLTALTAKNTLSLLRAELAELLDRGVYVGFLLLHPESDEVKRLAEHEFIRLGPELYESVRLLDENYVNRYPQHFAYRFFHHAPTFTAIMRDGDAIIRHGLLAQPEGGSVRVQPRAAHATQHKGVVLTFTNTTAAIPSAFSYFADDLRQQWDRALRVGHG